MVLGALGAILPGTFVRNIAGPTWVHRVVTLIIFDQYTV